MKHIIVPSFLEIKGRLSARKRITLAIRGKLETSEERSLEIDFMLVTNDIESTFRQPCTKYKTEVDCCLTEKDELIKTQNTFREQANQLISHIEIFTANSQNLEKNIKRIKTKTKSIEKFPGIRKMFKSATGLDTNDFLVIFKFLNIGPHCENKKLYDSQAMRELEKYTENVKPGMKAKFSATDKFFM